MTHDAGEIAACRELAAYLTGAEATQVGARLAAGQPLSKVLSVLGQQRGSRVRALLEAGGLDTDRARMLAVLAAVEGVHLRPARITPVWTSPGHLSGSGRLTSSIHRYVTAARESVICSTFNFQRSSALWAVLSEVAARPEVTVRIYMDTAAADERPAAWKPTTTDVARAMPGAAVFRTVAWEGSQVRNHAKFIAVDHQFLVVMSANFSRSAEHANVELGMVIEDPVITQSVEREMASLEAGLYERVS